MSENRESLDGTLSFFSGGGWVFWLTEKRGLIALLLPLILLGSFILYKTNVKKGQEADYVAADTAFRQWGKASNAVDAHFASLTALIKKHPELEGRYDTLMAQRLIARRDFDHAMQAAMRTVERSSDMAPYWADFGGTTLLIGKKEYKKALLEAERLKDDMLADERFFQENESISGGTLFSVNLMRIALLHKALNQPNEELMAWKQFKHFAGIEGEASAYQKESSRQVMAHFTQQNISLLDYIRHREEICSQLLMRG